MIIARMVFITILALGTVSGSSQILHGQFFGAKPKTQTPAPQSPAVQATAGEVQQAVTAESDLGVVEQTSWPSIALPKITMPQITMPRLWPSEEDDRPALLTPFVAGANKVTAGTKKAWEGVKDIFSVGSGNSSPAVNVAPAQPKPSIWKRLIGRAPQKQQVEDEPATVSDFLKQERILP